MSPEVHKVAGTMCLGLLCALIHLIRWPDWQLPSLFVKGFNVVDEIAAANIYIYIYIYIAGSAGRTSATSTRS